MPTVIRSPARSAELQPIDAPTPKQTSDSGPVIDSPPGPAVEPPSVDPVALRDAAMRALQADDDDTAYQLVRQATRLAPDDPQLIFVHALVLGNRNRFPEAIQMLDDLAREVPETRLPALGQTADWMVQFGQYTDAEKRYRELLSIAPDAALVRRQLASLLVRKGHRIDAATHLRYLCRLGDIRESELRTLLSVGVPIDGGNDESAVDPIGPLGKARIEVAAGQWQSARERLEDLDPMGAQEFALIGRTYVETNDFDALAKWSERLPDSANQYPDAWYAKGSLAAHRGNHARAVRCFAESLLRDQTDPQTYLQLSRSLANLGETDKSARAAQRAELILRTQTLASELAAMEQPDNQLLTSLVQTLRKLRRPDEAIAWRGVQLAYAQQRKTMSESEVQQALAEISNERSALQNDSSIQAESQDTKDFILCGVNIDDLPKSWIEKSSE